MALDPIITFNKLNEAYKDFLDAQFTFRNEQIDNAAKKALKKECELLNGPFIQAYMPYEGCKTLKDLVEEGLLNKDISRAFTNDEYAVYKRYIHQEKAIRLTEQGKSIIVASGTGSGKTECFFIPVINSLLDEISKGTLCPGVRTLIIYPMNALANDQMDRLRSSLKNIPEITFGRYIGETPDGDRSNIAKGRKDAANAYRTEKKEEPLQNELLTRAEMEAKPPHILITNYAMLEYMLLRATSQKIFIGQYSKYFKFLVLDEAHTYRGAHGTEVAMLIRRLKETIFGKVEDCLTCIGTSATLGGGADEKQKVVDFAQDLFAEKFTLDSIITSDRKKIVEVNSSLRPLSFYENLFGKYKDYDREDKSTILYNELASDRLIYEIRKRVVGSTMTISKLADELNKDLGITRNGLEVYIARIIELCGQAINPLDNNSLLNAKYHVFARSLEGGFITFADGIKIFTERRKDYNGYVVYELYNCMKCGQEYIEGSIENINGDEYLVPSESGSLFMLSNSNSNVAIDEDDEVIESDESSINLSEKNRFLICPKCGRLFEPNSTTRNECCGIKQEDFISIIKVDNKRNCYKCGAFNRGTVRKLTTSEDTAIEVLTRTLYQLLPEEKHKRKVQEENIWGVSTQNDETVSGRKLLVFSDNRQEAARFAVLIQNRYNDWMWKNLIYNEIKNMPEEEDRISVKRLAVRCYNTANRNNLFYNEKMTEEKEDFTKKQILKEVIELEPRMSLNRLGMINIKIGLVNEIDERIVQHFCNEYNLTKEEFKSATYFFFDSLRRQGCVAFPEGINHKDDTFEPRNFDAYFKLKGSSNEKGRQIFGFIPSNGRTNKRLSYVTNIFIKHGLSEQEAKEKGLEFMEAFGDSFERYFTETLPILKKDSKTQEYILNLENIFFEKAIPTYVCKKCGETTKFNAGICDRSNCGGELVLIQNNEDRGDYYRRIFSNIKIIPMNAKEHTAQLASQTATDLANSFKENDVNILSCSTTFEMGVDIGSLESVVLRNVPPETSNYIQRAGRAGRRGSSAAFILTFAKRRSHDLTYYKDPRKMINGVIKAPYIELNNAYLVRRHIHSMIFSYLSKIGYELKTTSDLVYSSANNGAFDINEAINSEQNINLRLYHLLKGKPPELLDSIKKVVPKNIQEELGVNNNWDFVKKLVDNNNPNNKEACLDNAVNDYLYVIGDLENTMTENVKLQKFDEAGKLKRVITTYNTKDYISFLAESNVLPRYGFPVYTVSLELNTDDITKNKIDLTRDLRMAITEYAPGAQVVANGKYWKPYALKRQPNREWRTYDFAICDKCNKKYFYSTALGVPSSVREETCCGKNLQYRQMVVPEFGFITKRSDKESKKLKNEAHYHSTAFFEGFLNDNEIEEKTIAISGKQIVVRYSPHGEMFIINGGNFSNKNRIVGVGFGICDKCGYVKTIDTYLRKDKSHLTAHGQTCTGELKQAYLGHYFKSDALVLKLPKNLKEDYNEESILYAIIEGASKYMEIDRREIGGAIWFNGDTSSINITLFDTVPNGAGHVKRMIGSINEILKCALEKVNGSCGCGEETCCYGCLRNYDNQIYHDTMTRGAALHYLKWLLNK